MAKEVFEKKDVEIKKVNSSSNFINDDKEPNPLSEYDKYKSIFDISISNNTVIFKVKNPR